MQFREIQNSYTHHSFVFCLFFADLEIVTPRTAFSSIILIIQMFNSRYDNVTTLLNNFGSFAKFQWINMSIRRRKKRSSHTVLKGTVIFFLTSGCFFSHLFALFWWLRSVFLKKNIDCNFDYLNISLWIDSYAKQIWDSTQCMLCSTILQSYNVLNHYGFRLLLNNSLLT